MYAQYHDILHVLKDVDLTIKKELRKLVWLKEKRLYGEVAVKAILEEKEKILND